MKKIVFLLSICLILVFTSCQGCENNKIFFVGSRTLNRINLKSFSKESEKFFNQMELSNYLSITKENVQNGKKTETNTRFRKYPIYLELTTSKETQIIAQEQNNIFKYTPINTNTYDREYLGKASEYDMSEELDSIDIFSDKVDININKFNIQHKKNQYIIKCRLVDGLDSKTKESIDRYFEFYNKPVDKLYRSILTMTYTFSDNQLIMTSSMTLDIDEDQEPININSTIRISTEEFYVTDMLRQNYVFSLPDHFEEVYETYNFGQMLYLGSYDPVYLKINAEKGIIRTDDVNLKLELYDMNHKKISETIEDSSRGYSLKVHGILPVYDSGTYYLVVRNRTSEKRNVIFEFYQYNTVFSQTGINLANISSFEENIEGKYDFEKFIYNNEDDEVHTVRIENTGSKTMTILKYDNSNEVFYYIKPKDVKYLNLRPGEDTFYICQDFNSSENLSSYLCKCNFEILPFYIPQNTVDKEIPKGFTLKSETGITYYTKLEKGVYSFLSDPWERATQSVVVRDANGKYLDVVPVKISECDTYFSSHYVIPEDGWYYVSVTNYSDDTETIYYQKHNYDNIPDKDNPLFIIVSDVNSNKGVLEGLHDFEYYRLENNTKDTKVYCITNESNVPLVFVFNHIKHDHMDEFKNEYRISPGEKLYFFGYPGVTDIPLISYHSTDSKDEKINYSFKVSEIKNPNSENIYSSYLKEITEEFSDNYYLFGSDIPTTYMKFVLKEKCFISFDYEICYIESANSTITPIIYDSTGKKVNIRNLFEPGEYRVAFELSFCDVCYMKVKYTSISAEPHNINVTLKELGYSLNSNKFSEIYNQRYSYQQIVKYHFTLKEKSVIIFAHKDVMIYNQNEELLVFPPNEEWNNNTLCYIALPPGNYYFTTTDSYGLSGSNSSPIRIGIKNNIKNSIYDVDNPQIIEVGTPMTCKNSSSSDVQYFQFKIDEAADYTFDIETGRLILYNESKEYIGPLNETITKYKYLTEGTYYLVITNVSNSIKEYTIIINKFID